MGAIGITLSNGEQSPFFSAKRIKTSLPIFKINQTIKPIEFRVWKGSRYIFRFSLIGENGENLCDWDGNGSLSQSVYEKTQKIPEDREIIGIYGSLNGSSGIVNFGLITVKYELDVVKKLSTIS